MEEVPFSIDEITSMKAFGFNLFIFFKSFLNLFSFPLSIHLKNRCFNFWGIVEFTFKSKTFTSILHTISYRIFSLKSVLKGSRLEEN